MPKSWKHISLVVMEYLIMFFFFGKGGGGGNWEIEIDWEVVTH